MEQQEYKGLKQRPVASPFPQGSPTGQFGQFPAQGYAPQTPLPQPSPPNAQGFHTQSPQTMASTGQSYAAPIDNPFNFNVYGQFPQQPQMQQMLPQRTQPQPQPHPQQLQQQYLQQQQQQQQLQQQQQQQQAYLQQQVARQTSQPPVQYPAQPQLVYQNSQTVYSPFNPASPFTPADNVPSFGADAGSSISAFPATVFRPQPQPPLVPSTPMPRSVSAVTSRQSSDSIMSPLPPPSLLVQQFSAAPSVEHTDRGRHLSQAEVEKVLMPLRELAFTRDDKVLSEAVESVYAHLASLPDARESSPTLSPSGTEPSLPFVVDGHAVVDVSVFSLKHAEIPLNVIPTCHYNDSTGTPISGAALESIHVNKGKRTAHPSTFGVEAVVFDLSNKRGAQKVSKMALEFKPQAAATRVGRSLFAYHEESRRVLQLHVTDGSAPWVCALPVEQLKAFGTMAPSTTTGSGVDLYQFRVLFRQPNGVLLVLPKAVFFIKLRPEPNSKRQRMGVSQPSDLAVSGGLPLSPATLSTGSLSPYPYSFPPPLPIAGLDSDVFRGSLLQPVDEEPQHVSAPRKSLDSEYVKVEHAKDKTALPGTYLVESVQTPSSTSGELVRLSPATSTKLTPAASLAAASPAVSAASRKWTLSDYVRDTTVQCLWADDAFRHIEVELHLGVVSSPSDTVSLELQDERGRYLVLQPVFQSPTVLLFELSPALQKRHWPKAFETAPIEVPVSLLVNGSQHSWTIRFVTENELEDSEEESSTPSTPSHTAEPAPTHAQAPPAALPPPVRSQSAVVPSSQPHSQSETPYARHTHTAHSVPEPVPDAYSKPKSTAQSHAQQVRSAVAEADAAYEAEQPLRVAKQQQKQQQAEPSETSDPAILVGAAAARQASAASTATPQSAPKPTAGPAPAASVPYRPLPRAANPSLDQALQNGFKNGLIDNAALEFYEKHAQLNTDAFVSALLESFPPGKHVSARQIVHAMMKPFLDEFKSNRVQEIAFLTFLLLFGPFQKCYDKFTCLIVPPSGDGRPPGRRSWFWGRDTDRGVAASNIQNADKGTFLIRLSSNGVSFAVTYIDEDGSLKHSRILNSIKGYHFEDQADLFSSLHELVRSFPHIFKCAFRDPNECVSFRPLDGGAPIKVPVKLLQKHPETLLGKMFDPKEDEVEGAEYEVKQFDFAVAKGTSQQVYARREVFTAILDFYRTDQVKADKLDVKELEQALELFQIPKKYLSIEEGR